MDLGPQFAQRMMLSQRMLVAAHVLQLSVLDLRTYLKLEMEENPLLEEEAVCEDDFDRELAEFDEGLTRLSESIQDTEEFCNSSGERMDAARQQKQRYLESLIVKEESLYEHLNWQLNMLAENERQRRIGRFLIGNLDTDGYLTISLKDTQDMLGESIGSIKRALSLIRSFDPIGVGARDLKEALLIQLISSGKADSQLYKIIYFHLEDIARGNYKKIADNLRISLNDVHQAKQRIAHLESKPGRAFSVSEVARKIVPDVYLDKNNGSYNIVVNEKGLPRLRINQYYTKILRNKTIDRNTAEFVRKKFFCAKWLLDAVNKRRLTIERVCKYLTEVQKDFLEIGELGIKPLTLKDVAGSLSISEATVSRVVSNKYLQTPQRIYKLKQFFAGAIKRQGRPLVSDKYIKMKIETLIEDEDRRKPLSDASITSVLKKEGIDISRRTVTKYRKNLRILPSYLRKY
jgi:RNA polymerase sigma-54 factor